MSSDGLLAALVSEDSQNYILARQVRRGLSFSVSQSHKCKPCTITIALLLTLLTAEAFLLGGAVRDIRSDPRSGDLFASSLAEIGDRL